MPTYSPKCTEIISFWQVQKTLDRIQASKKLLSSIDIDNSYASEEAASAKIIKKRLVKVRIRYLSSCDFIELFSSLCRSRVTSLRAHRLPRSRRPMNWPSGRKTLTTTTLSLTQHWEHVSRLHACKTSSRTWCKDRKDNISASREPPMLRNSYQTRVISLQTMHWRMEFHRSKSQRQRRESPPTKWLLIGQGSGTRNFIRLSVF